MKAIKTIFWVCVFAALALVVRVTTTVNKNDIDRLIINTIDGGSYVIDTSFDDSIADGIQNVLQYNPDAVVISETRHYENGDILKWEANGERICYKYIWHVPVLGRIAWHWSVIGSETTGVPLGEL